MDGQILGLNANMFWALIFIILLVILGIVSFHYYGYVSGTEHGGIRAGAGAGVAIFPGPGDYAQMKKNERY